MNGFASNMTCVIAEGGNIGLYAGRSVADGGCSFTFIAYKTVKCVGKKARKTE